MHPTRIIRTTGFRLAAIYAGLFGLSVCVLLAVIYWIASDAMQAQLTSTIEAEMAALSADENNRGPAHTAESIRQRLESGVHQTMYYLLVDADGRRIAGNLEVGSPRKGWRRFPIQNGGIAGGDTGDDPEHQVLALGKRLAGGHLLVVGEDTYRIVEMEEAIVRAFGWAFGITILLAAFGGVLLSFGFLRRIDAIERTSRAIMEGRLADRVPTRGTGDELDRLALNLNEMLDRVQALMESLQQVSNDIAHDLRTPLSRLRQRLEAARTGARSVADYEKAVDQAIDDADAILKTFGALLRIAQIEAGTRKAAFAPVDLSALFQAIADAYGAVAEDGGRTLSAAIAPGLSIDGDRELLTQMLANLVENAIHHTPEKTAIRVALENGPSGPVAIVADHGSGIPAEAREQVFRRFFRLDRSRSTSGSGLGLSLVAAVADLHDVEITLEDNEPGLRVVLLFRRQGRMQT